MRSANHKLMTLSKGDRLGRYEILEPIGAGGMGDVWRARDTELGREVAVKVLPDKVAANPTRLDRIRLEARTPAALSHTFSLAMHERMSPLPSQGRCPTTTRIQPEW